jgi:hypothetical protein
MTSGNPISQNPGVEMASKIYAVTALSSSVLRRHSSLRDGGDESGDGGSRSTSSATLPCAHIYPLPVALFPALY